MSTLIGDLLLRVRGDGSEGQQTLDQTQGGLKGLISPANLVKGGLMAAGAGASAMASKVRPLNEANSRLAIQSGLSADAVRQMTLDLTDATFPIEDVQSGMDELISRGIETEEQFRHLLPVFDQFADATGKDMANSIRLADEVLSAFGIPLDEAGDHMDTLTHVTERTDIPLSTLQRNLGRVPDELDAMNISLDDSVAYIEAFRDRGYTGQEAVREFRRAVEEADGDMEKFQEITGFTNEEMEKYADRINDAEGLTEELADQVRIGPWGEFQQRLSEITFQYGEQIEAIGQYGFVLTGVTPLIGKLGGGIKALIPMLIGAAKATWGFTAALLANPITWIIVAIVALIAAVWLLWNNWDQVSEFLVNAWDWIKDRAEAIWGAIADFLTNLWEGVANFFSNLWDSIADIFSGGWDTIKNLFLRLHPLGWVISNWEEVKQFFIDIWNSIADFFSNIWDSIRSIFTRGGEDSESIFVRQFEAIRDFYINIWESILDFFRGIWDSLNNLTGGRLEDMRDRIFSVFRRVEDFIHELWGAIRAFFEEWWQMILALFRGDLDAMTEHFHNAFGGIFDFIRDIWGRIRNFFSDIFSDILNNLTQWGRDMISSARQSARDVFNSIMDWLRDLPNELLNLGRRMIENFARGIRDAIGSVGQAIGSVAQAVRDRLPFSPAKEGPLRDEPDFVDYLTSGIEGATADIGRLLEGALEGGAQTGVAVGGAGGSYTIIIELDSRQIAKSTYKHLPKELRLKTGLR